VTSRTPWRAEEEYRSLDSGISRQANSSRKRRQRLREVQEVLAQREFNIGPVLYLRLGVSRRHCPPENAGQTVIRYTAARTRRCSLLGQSYEGEIDVIRKNGRMNEVGKGKMIEQLTKEASIAYDRIIKALSGQWDRAIDAKNAA